MFLKHQTVNWWLLNGASRAENPSDFLVLGIFTGPWSMSNKEVDVDLLCLMTWCLWWVLQQQAGSSAADRGLSAKPLFLFHPDHWTSAEPRDWGGETSDCEATAQARECICAGLYWVCVSYSQYCSLGLWFVLPSILEEGQVPFSWVQFVTKTPLTLHCTRK